MRLLTESDWLAVAEGPLDTPEDFRIALSKLREAAEKRFATLLQPALVAFVGSNGKKINDMSELSGYLPPTFDRSMLQRYRIAPASDFKNISVGGDWVITQTSLVDEYDSRLVVGPFGFGAHGSRPR